MPAAGNVLISNVPGPPTPLYVAGAEMMHYYPMSIPYHGNALNITVHSSSASRPADASSPTRSRTS